MKASDNWRFEVPEITESGLYMCGELVVAQKEKPIQQDLVSRIAEVSSGKIIEFGYGLGFAYRAIQNTQQFTEHWVVEGNYHIANECIKAIDNQSSPPPVLIVDTWEHASDTLPENYFDAVYFDPYPFDEEAQGLERWINKFIFVANKAKPLLRRILLNQGVVGFINFDPENLSQEIATELFRSNLNVVYTSINKHIN